jgi:hypothetical protein
MGPFSIIKASIVFEDDAGEGTNGQVERMNRTLRCLVPVCGGTDLLENFLAP